MATTSDENLASASNKECEPLIRASHINIYRENTFRITGLAVDASEKDIKKHADKLKMMEELGYGQGANAAAYTLDPSPSVDQIREAMQRLKDPEDRLIDEFFWFWPQEFGKSGSDPAIQAIISGDSGAAYDIWMRMESEPAHNYIASHNIAVMFHLIALDWTLYHISSELDAEREVKIKGYWKESFSHWEKVAIDDRVWDVVKSRIRSLNDPRLTTGFARRMRDTLPFALDKINASVALRFAEKGEMNWAKVHIDFMNETHQGLDDVEKTAELVLAPTRTRILQYIKSATEDCEKNPNSGYDLTRKLIEQCTPLQNLFELFHGNDSHHKTELFDEVSITCLNCMVEFQKATGDNKTFLIILKNILSFATSMDVRERIRKNIKIGEGNLRSDILDPHYKTLKSIQESKHKAKVRLGMIQSSMMPLISQLTTQEGVNSELTIDISDAITIVLRGISIDAFNNENDVVTAAESMRLASKIVRDPDLKKRIDEDLLVMIAAEVDSICYFCGKKPSDTNKPIKVPMYGEVTRSYGQVNYRHTDVAIPCCNTCNDTQKLASRIGYGLWIVSTLIGCGITADGRGGWIGGAFWGGVVGWMISLITKKVVKSIAGIPSVKNYKRVKDLRAKGWSFGTSPGKYG